MCLRAAVVAPRAVVCGESALALHELIDDIPAAVHIAVPRGSTRPTISYLPTVVARYAAATFDVGAERFDAASGETIPVYDAARSVVEMRHRARIGESLALSALGCLLADHSVDRFTQQVGVAVVPRVLLDHVGEDVAQRDGLASEVDCVVKGVEGRGDGTGAGALLAPNPERLADIGVLDVELGERAIDLYAAPIGC